MTTSTSTSSPASLDTELDLLFQQSNAATLTEIKAEDIIHQLNQKPSEILEIKKDNSEAGEDGDKSTETPTISRKERKELLSDSQEKSERTLFLGNLPVSCAGDKALIKALKARFSTYGVVESIRFRSIPFAEPQARRVAYIKKNFRKDGTGGTCNGYLVMKTREGALAALKENATIFADRHLRVDLAAEGEGSSKTNTKKSIFIGNLPMDLEEEPVWQLFGKCGAVTNVRLIRDKVSNMGKGIGYVTFASKDSVNVAVKLAGTQLGGRPIRVSPCAKLGMVEKKKARAQDLAEKRQKQAAALIKPSNSDKSNNNNTNTNNSNSTKSSANAAVLGAPKSDSKSAPPQDQQSKQKVSKKEAKLQAELKTKFGQLFHTKFPFAQAISAVKSEAAAEIKVVKKKKDGSTGKSNESKSPKTIKKTIKSSNPSKPSKSLSDKPKHFSSKKN